MYCGDTAEYEDAPKYDVICSLVAAMGARRRISTSYCVDVALLQSAVADLAAGVAAVRTLGTRVLSNLAVATGPQPAAETWMQATAPPCHVEAAARADLVWHSASGSQQTQFLQEVSDMQPVRASCVCSDTLAPGANEDHALRAQGEGEGLGVKRLRRGACRSLRVESWLRTRSRLQKRVRTRPL